MNEGGAPLRAVASRPVQVAKPPAGRWPRRGGRTFGPRDERASDRRHRVRTLPGVRPDPPAGHFGIGHRVALAGARNQVLSMASVAIVQVPGSGRSRIYARRGSALDDTAAPRPRGSGPQADLESRCAPSRTWCVPHQAESRPGCAPRSRSRDSTCLVEDQDARVGENRARDGSTRWRCRPTASRRARSTTVSSLSGSGRRTRSRGPMRQASAIWARRRRRENATFSRTVPPNRNGVPAAPRRAAWGRSRAAADRSTAVHQHPPGSAFMEHAHQADDRALPEPLRSTSA